MTDVQTKSRVASVKEFVARLARRDADDIEKLLVHLLDAASNYWNKRATRYLTELKRPDVTADQAKDLKKEYNRAFNNVNRVMRMRHGCSISKRTY